MPDTPSQNPPLDTRLHVLVPAALKERLDELAAEREVSLGALVREILMAGVFPMRFITGIDPADVSEVDLERWSKMPMVLMPPGGVHIHDGTEKIVVSDQPYLAHHKSLREAVVRADPLIAAGLLDPRSMFDDYDPVLGAPATAAEAVQAERAGVLGEA